MTTISEKRANETDDVYYKANVVLVDIEGTTTSIDFVKNTLFPYVRKNLDVYLKSKWNDDQFKEDLKLLQEQSKQDEADGIEGLVKIPEGFSEDICEDVKKNVLWQMDLDRKTKALKELQGHIWREAYNKGEVKAHVYPDVAPALKSWKQTGKDIYVYSSGSVEAQKLLFGHTQDGNLLEHFAGYFDTTVGPKVEESSYSNIVNSVKCKSEEIIFFTDVPKEARAAKSAGLQAVIVVREGNLPITDDDKLEFPVIKSFEDVVFETSVKRRKKSEEEPLEDSKTNSAVAEECSTQDVEMQEEPIAVKTETSKSTEGVSSSEMAEAVNKQPAVEEPCAMSEETKQTSCKEKETLNNDLASTKQIGTELVSNKGAEEVKGQTETNSKTLEVNGEKLDAGNDDQMESNGPKCPKDNLSESAVNNIDNLPVTGNVHVVPDKTDTKLSDNEKTKPNKTEKCERDKTCDATSQPTGKAHTNSDTDSKANVESLTEKTESTSADTAELPNKTECTLTEKTENVNAKTECTTIENSESATVCKKKSPKPIDSESAVTKKTEGDKTEPMETDDLKNKEEAIQKSKQEVTNSVSATDISSATDEVKGKVAVASNEKEAPAAPTDSKMDTTDKAEEAATPDSGKVAEESTLNDTTVKAIDRVKPDSGKVEAEATSDRNKVEATVEATPGSGKTAVETTSDGSKVELADKAAPAGGKVEAAAEAAPAGGKVEAAAEAAPAGGNVEAAVEAISVTDKAHAANDSGETVTSDKVGAVSVAEVKVDNGTDVPMKDAEPMVTDDAEKVSTDKVKSMVKDESEPMVTDEPMATDEAKPISEKAKNKLTNDAEPMATDDAEPTVASKDETVKIENDGDSEKPKIVSSGSVHVSDNTNCNSVDKDVAVKDPKESTGTGKTDAAAVAGKDGEALTTKTESSNTENKISKAEEQNIEVENAVAKNGSNSCVENGESTEKTDNTSEKLKIATESTDKVVENVVST